MCKQLVWDYKQGDIICVETGEVVGRIYDYTATQEKDEWRQLIISHKARSKTRLAMTIAYKKRKKRIRIYTRMMMIKKWLDKEFVLDEEKYLEAKLNNKNQVYTIIHKKTLEIHETEEDKKIIKKGEEYLMKKAPHLLSRTLRGRKALCYITGMVLEKNMIPTRREVMEKFKIGETTYKRLINTVKSIIK